MVLGGGTRTRTMPKASSETVGTRGQREHEQEGEERPGAW